MKYINQTYGYIAVVSIYMKALTFENINEKFISKDLSQSLPLETAHTHRRKHCFPADKQAAAKTDGVAEVSDSDGHCTFWLGLFEFQALSAGAFAEAGRLRPLGIRLARSLIPSIPAANATLRVLCLLGSLVCLRWYT